MPELPEVQTTVSGLQRYAQSQTITHVTFNRENIRYPLDTAWIAHIEKQSIIRISRRAKLIVMQLSKGYLLWHLGMTGSLRVSDNGEVRRLHDHIEMTLSGGNILRFHDPRRFGYLKWFANQAALRDSIAHYGVEPLSDDFSGKWLYHYSRGKKQAVKNVIMNQAVVVGVGNIYACEALFLSGIRPQTPCGRISQARYDRLVAAIKKVLQRAIALGGTTLRDFENADAKPGYFQQSLLVYGREGEPCRQCQSLITAVKLGGRNSFYCPKCQR